jgi:hypothetical protein
MGQVNVDSVTIGDCSDHRRRIFRKSSWTDQEREVNLNNSRSVEMVGSTASMSTANSIGVVNRIYQEVRREKLKDCLCRTLYKK